MKRLLFLICVLTGFLCQDLTAQAANYKFLEWDVIGLSYVLPASDGVKGGIGMYSEPRFNVKDNISIGLRYDIAIFGTDIEDESADLGATASFALMGDYYFKSTTNKRAFAGVGIGSFAGGTFKVDLPDGTSQETDGGSSLGIIPRVGYELGLLRLQLEYNYTFKEEVPKYLALKFGLNIGGRYKG